MTIDQMALAGPTALLDAIAAEVAGWPGVRRRSQPHGGVDFLLGPRELGRLHAARGRAFADLPFPRGMRDRLVAEGRARPHRALREAGWLTAPIGTFVDVANVIALFRAGYERAGALECGLAEGTVGSRPTP